MMAKLGVDQVTPYELYLNRREFLKKAGIVTASSLLLAACREMGVSLPTATPGSEAQPTQLTPGGGPTRPPAMVETEEGLSDPVTDGETAEGFTNYYEFSTSKTGVADVAADFQTSPWQVEVGGLVRHPHTYTMEELSSKFPAQERIYRHRCVEGWSMVIPWLGFPLSLLLEDVEPLGDAQYVRMETIFDPAQMPGQVSLPYPWPYVEGLRLDEAMHELTILATGMYGMDLPPQNGAPLRLVVPWKYGFKSIKSVVKIDLVAEQPTTFWMSIVPQAYGFYANVNPDVPHPNWSQATELRLGEETRRPTLLFNGYGDQVAHLYAGMDLTENF
jgi:sulfoxide reductase catalytic subunit YedY